MTANIVPDAAVPSQRGADHHDIAAGLVRDVRVGRQGIYRADRSLVAYELLFRAPGEDAGAVGVAGERATSQVIAATFGTFGLENISDGRPVFINFTRAFLTGVIPIPVEPERVVLEIVENVVVDQELLIGLSQLSAEGYRIALDDHLLAMDHPDLLELANYVKIDIDAISSVMLPGIVQRIHEAEADLIAVDVQDAATFERCRAVGAELFQGPFLQRPTVLERRTLSPSQLICVRLLNDLADPDLHIEHIEQMVGTDPGLTLRLLRTANSAGVGANHEVTSLRQALVLIGPRRLRSWVMLTLLEGGTTTDASDNLWSVLARAYTCQRLAGGEADLAFTVGLLSGAADLLGAQPEVVAEGAGVGPDARAALLDGEGAAGRALAAVLAHEHDDPAAIAETGLVPFDVSRTYLEALSESLALVHSLVRN